jgi:hypothetical protein
LSTVISRWPLGTEPQHPQWGDNTAFSYVTDFLSMCVFYVPDSELLFMLELSLSRTTNFCSYISQQLPIYCSLIRFHPLSDNSQLSIAVSFIMLYYERF